MVYLLETGCHQQSPLPLSLSLSLYLPWSSPYLTFSFALFLPGCLSLFLSLGFSFVILILQFGFSSSDLELYFATRLSWHFRQSPRGRKDPRIVIVTDTCRAAIGPSSRTNRIVSDIKPPKISTHPCCQRACVESVFWVMPLTKLLADALGVVTISLVTISSLLGTLCIFYSFYFRSHIRTQGYNRLKYFSGPWAIRIIFIFFTIWWGLGEILRLEFIRQEGRLLNTLTLKWQDIVCKCYIVSNLGFSEPCLFLTLVFLLRASLQKTESGPLSQNFNFKTTIYILLFCFPILALQTITVVLGHRYETGSRGYFFKITSPPLNNVSRCYYPLTSTTLLGLFATLLNLYLFYLGRKILKLVISKGLRKRVLILIIAVSSFFPLRILLLGLSVLSKPGDTVFEVLAFLAFLSLLCCAEVAICMLVYYPIADSLKLKNLQDIEDRRRIIEEYNDTLSLIANQSPISGGADSGKQGSISFRMMEREENPGAFVELSLFSPSQRSSPVGSPRLSGWPMLPSSGG